MDMEEALKLAFERNMEKHKQETIDESEELAIEVKNVITKFLKEKEQEDDSKIYKTATAITFALASNMIVMALCTGISKEFVPDFLSDIIRKISEAMDKE